MASEKKLAIKAVIEKHIAAWNDLNETTRLAAIEELYTPDVKVADPKDKQKGREFMNGVITGFQQQFSGAKISIVGDIDIHHNGAYYKWDLAPEGQPPVASGVDFVLLKENQIKTLYVFVNK